MFTVHSKSYLCAFAVALALGTTRAHAQTAGTNGAGTATKPARSPAKEGSASTDGASKDSAGKEQKAEAAKHFETARELYEHGSYTEARTELEFAYKLDPEAKDLAFNLGVVCEKLQEYDAALKYFRAYSAMIDVTTQEREKADGIVRRIEGAKRTQQQKSAVVPPEPPRVIYKTVTVREKAKVGRLDALTYGAFGVAGAGLVLGGVMGTLAITTQPGAPETTSASRPYADLVSAASRARTFATVADISFITAGVFAIAGIILFFARTADPEPESPSKGDSNKDTPTKDAKDSAWHPSRPLALSF
jgi:Tetratricopeptide repeat